jgi:hypothetical protein
VKSSRAAVASASFDEGSGEPCHDAVLVDAAQPCVVHCGARENAAVVKALSVGAEGAVDEDAVAGGVVALPRPPGRPDDFGTLDDALGSEPGADAVGEVFTVGVGDGEGDDLGRSMGGDAGHHGVGECLAGGVG